MGTFGHIRAHLGLFEFIWVHSGSFWLTGRSAGPPVTEDLGLEDARVEDLGWEGVRIR